MGEHRGIGWSGIMAKRVPWKKEKRKVCNSEGECKFTKVKAAEQKLWLEYFEYGFEHRVRGSEVGTHPVWDVCRGSEGMQGERES